MNQLKTITPSIKEILREMRRSGGPFVQAMAEAAALASEADLLRLRDAFPEYFETYRRILRQKALRGEPS